MTISPLISSSPALTPVLTFISSTSPFLYCCLSCLVFIGIENDIAFDITIAASLNIGLDLQSASDCLVVVHAVTRHEPSGFGIGLDLQAASHCLIVIVVDISGFDVRFNFHPCPSPFEC